MTAMTLLMTGCGSIFGNNETACLWLPTPYMFSSKMEYDKTNRNLILWLDDYNSEWDIYCNSEL